jgi:hypothetical protein
MSGVFALIVVFFLLAGPLIPAMPVAAAPDIPRGGGL